jgi:hypothetical protein
MGQHSSSIAGRHGKSHEPSNSCAPWGSRPFSLPARNAVVRGLLRSCGCFVVVPVSNSERDCRQVIVRPFERVGPCQVAAKSCTSNPDVFGAKWFGMREAGLGATTKHLRPPVWSGCKSQCPCNRGAGSQTEFALLGGRLRKGCNSRDLCGWV